MSSRILPIHSNVVRKNGTYRHRFKVRALCQSIGLVLLVIGYTGYRSFIPGSTVAPNGLGAVEDIIVSSIITNDITTTTTTTTHNDYTTTTTEQQQQQQQQHRRRLADETPAPTPAPTSCRIVANPAWMVVWWILLLIYMFLALSIVCDEFFVPALEVMSDEHHLNLSMDVAGATLMAAGGSAPELATNFVATFQESELGIGTIVGSAVFNVLFVIAMCSLLAKTTLTLTWWPLFRDATYYAITLIVLALFLSVSGEGKIVVWESIVLLVLYLGYCTFMYFNQFLYKALTGKELEYPEEPNSDDDDDDDDDDDKKKERDDVKKDSMDDEIALEALKQEEETATPSEAFVLPKQGSYSNRTISKSMSHATATRHWQNTFRAGILKLLRDPDSWLDTAGVGIVAKMAGDVNQVFSEVDVNGDGSIDRHELGLLFEKLECHLSPHELDEVFVQLDTDGDNQISANEFSHWYVRSEERILSQVRHVFDTFDVNHSSTIDRHELKQLLGKLEPRVTDDDVEDAIRQMYQSGSRDEITFDEFSEWYKHSLIYQRQMAHVEEDMEGVSGNLVPPTGKDASILAWLKYLFLLPLLFVLCWTIPDVQRPGLAKWCYFSFILSIFWIGAFSYGMVEAANILGATAGIPDVIMGLTFIAAGTSIPDLLSSVIVARRGYGDMAVSSSIGSNIFDITVGLPLPWLLYQIWPNGQSGVTIETTTLWKDICILLGMLVFIICAIHCQGWKLTKTLGGFMFVFYFAFLGQAIYFGMKDYTPQVACL